MSLVEGDGYAVGSLDDLGEGTGIRKVRRAFGVTAFGVNALVIPEGYDTPRHSHERQEELYFVHAGELDMTFADGDTHRIGPGALALVKASTVRSMRAIGGDAVVLCVGGEDGYVGRDGVPEAQA